MGVVAAPLEGFVELDIKKRADGKEYLAAKFAGPIRGAGGTAMAVCLLIIDYVRTLMQYERYDPSADEVSRVVTELDDYHERITNLQYKPSSEEIRYLISHTPIEVEHFNAVMDAGGWSDVTRNDIPEGQLYSWWSYRARDWDTADKGRRLDHVWATPDIASAGHSSRVVRHVRGWEKPSDHAPVFATFDL